MNKSLTIMFIVLCVSTVSAVPMMISYQGRLEVNGLPFDDTGDFKFALVNEPDTPSVSFWSNDGTSVAGSEPAAAVTISVQDGLYSVILGESGGMNPLDGSEFSSDVVYLRVWFDDGTNGFQQLSPDQRITSLGFAVRATIADDADTVDGMEGSDLEESAEIDSDIATHAAVADAHHAKTTSFSELLDSATDAQIPDDITLAQSKIQSALSNDFHNIGGTDEVTDADSDPSNEIQDLASVLTEGNDGEGSDITNVGALTASALIAHSSPEGVLTLKRQDNTNGGNKIKFQNSGGWYQWNIHQTVGAPSDLCFAGGNAEFAEDLPDHLTIKNNGNVGIGTQEPEALLHVAGTAQIGSRLFVNEQGYVGIDVTALDHPFQVNHSFGNLVIDQGSVSLSSVDNETNFWQSFTPSISGLLGRIQIFTSGYNDITLSIYEGQGIDGALLGSEDFIIDGPSDWKDLDLSIEVFLNSGTEYTFYIEGMDNFYNMTHSTYEYPGGVYCCSEIRDLSFKTWMKALSGFSFLVANSGDVGIGVENPSFRLDIHDDTPSFIANFRNELDASNSNGIKIRGGDSGSETGADYINFRNPDDDPMGKIEQDSSSSVIYATTSDKRLKTGIHNTGFSISDLMNIQVVDYAYLDSPGNYQTGFLAQQLYEYFPDAVSPGGDDPKKDPWMIDYGRLTPLLVKAVQEQQIRIERLENELSLKNNLAEDQAETITEQLESISELMNTIQDLKKRMERVEGLIE